jgi:ferredoxin-type protein NapF
METILEGSVNLSRRGFLKAQVVADARDAVVRPPWALAEEAFQQACTRCDACQKACETAIVVRGDGGFPEVDFQQGECTFCGACRTACTDGALQQDTDVRPWAWQARIDARCLALHSVVCRSCGDVCEVRAISFLPMPGGVGRPVVAAKACTGCGACIKGCPVAAISMTNHQEGAVQ